MNRIFIRTVAGLAFAVTLAACAETPVYLVPADAGEPVQNVGPDHGNLQAAQALLRTAYDRMSDAQQANDGRLGGHAARAKELLREAALEVGAAGAVADSR